jgi:hypothetical protein
MNDATLLKNAIAYFIPGHDVRSNIQRNKVEASLGHLLQENWHTMTRQDAEDYILRTLASI